ncbi:MAG: hypothetical protein A2V90_05345 [Gammaproteobacteria bacterium RBG_16_57_12]|nr:MAG: hypothetical protein A2V90_05345 [Gammaproteobacteria bacterium RBG_16_57_12]
MESEKRFKVTSPQNITHDRTQRLRERYKAMHQDADVFRATYHRKREELHDKGVAPGESELDEHQVDQLLKGAEAAAGQEDYETALAQARQAYDLLANAIRAMMAHVPKALAQTEQAPPRADSGLAQEQYRHERQRLDYFKQAHQATYQRASAEHPVSAPDYDHKLLAVLEQQATELEAQQKYADAIPRVQRAQAVVITALRQLMNEHSMQMHLLQEQATATAQPEPVDNSALRLRYERELQRLSYFKQAHQRNYERATAQGDTAMDYDRPLLAKLENELAGAVKREQYGEAIQLLKQAQGLVIAALRIMLDDHDFVVVLDISTPELEYKYELNRYLGYEELIPVAISMMRLESDQQEQVLQMSEKGHWMIDQARQRAQSGDYPVAIRMVQDATSQIQQALRQAGAPVLTGPPATPRPEAN